MSNNEIDASLSKSLVYYWNSIIHWIRLTLIEIIERFSCGYLYHLIKMTENATERNGMAGFSLWSCYYNSML